MNFRVTSTEIAQLRKAIQTLENERVLMQEDTKKQLAQNELHIANIKQLECALKYFMNRTESFNIQIIYYTNHFQTKILFRNDKLRLEQQLKKEQNEKRQIEQQLNKQQNEKRLFAEKNKSLFTELNITTAEKTRLIAKLAQNDEIIQQLEYGNIMI